MDRSCGWLAKPAADFGPGTSIGSVWVAHQTQALVLDGPVFPRPTALRSLDVTVTRESIGGRLLTANIEGSQSALPSARTLHKLHKLRQLFELVAVPGSVVVVAPVTTPAGVGGGGGRWTGAQCGGARGRRRAHAFDETVAWLATQSSKHTVTQLMRIAWRTVGSIITRVWADVDLNFDRLAGLRRIGIDEISYRRTTST